MKSFKQFIKNIKPVMISAQPMHGAHSKPKPPILITAQPFHGAHARKKKKLKEATGEHGPEAHNVQKWDADHSLNHHLGHDEFKITKKLHEDEDDFHKRPGVEHVVDYTEHSTAINHHLIDKAKGKQSRYPDAVHKEKMKGIDTALHHSKMKHDIHVYHGANFHPDELAKQHPERKIKTPAYLSTTHDKQTARMFSSHNMPGKRHVLHIHVKKGNHALFLGKHSTHPHEHETLIPRGTTLQVHHKPDVLHDGTKVWHAHITDQEHHQHD